MAQTTKSKIQALFIGGATLSTPVRRDASVDSSSF